MNNEKTCSLNYEAEYERLVAEREKMCCELACYREKFMCIEQENREMRAKLDMVYLIFGKQ